jgi:hypothetical protein
MGARQSTYRTRDLTREGKITVHIFQRPACGKAGEKGTNECDAILDRIEKRRAKQGD